MQKGAVPLARSMLSSDDDDYDDDILCGNDATVIYGARGESN